MHFITQQGPEIHQTKKRNEHTDHDVEWLIAERPGSLKAFPKNIAVAKLEKVKAQIRAKVEHPFLKVKRQFGYDQTRYKGMAKNTNRLSLLLGFANLLTAKNT